MLYDKLGNSIAEIIEINKHSYEVKLKFSDGFIGVVTLKNIFTPPLGALGLAEDILRNAQFDKCFVKSGALVWPNGLDLCPDAIRMWIEQK
jgi:hypothetical protein